LKALPLSSGLALLIFMSAFASGGDMGRKERYSAGDQALCFHLHHVCTAEMNTNYWWFCWRTLPGIYLTARSGVTEQRVQ